MSTGIDYAWAHPSVAALKQAGVTFACRYLSRDSSKNLTLGEAQQLHAAGIATVSNWEYNPGAAKAGYAQGVADARDAAAQHAAAGGPTDRPIYFSIDWDASAAELDGPVAQYCRGAASVIGLSRTGAYGGYRTVKRLLDLGLIRWAWQTYAWSGGAWDSRAHIRQVRNGVQVGGVDCDMDQSMTNDFGQWPGGNVDELTRLASNGDRWGLATVTGQPAKFLGGDGKEYPADNALHAKLDKLIAGQATAAPVVLTQADRDAIVAALAGLVPTAEQIAKAVLDGEAARLQS